MSSVFVMLTETEVFKNTATMTALCLPADLFTFITYSVKYSSLRIKGKSVMLHQMSLQLFKLLTLKMDELSALFTFAVKAGNALPMAVRSHILKTCGATGIKNVFVDYPVVYQILKLPVDGSLADGVTLFLKVIAHIICRDVHARNGFKILKQYFFLFGLVFAVVFHSFTLPGLKRPRLRN